MTVDPDVIAARVVAELNGYVVPEYGERALGSALPQEWFAENLKQMRAALVKPYPIRPNWADHNLLVVLESNEGSLFAYDPCEEGEFALLLRQNNEIYDCHVRGDAVGGFLSR